LRFAVDGQAWTNINYWFQSTTCTNNADYILGTYAGASCNPVACEAGNLDAIFTTIFHDAKLSSNVN